MNKFSKEIKQLRRLSDKEIVKIFPVKPCLTCPGNAQLRSLCDRCYKRFSDEAKRKDRINNK